MKILVVDDRAPNRHLLRAQLEGEGHAVAEAADGVEALEVLAREPFDAVISDILMPRMDGYRFCHEVRRSERLRELPFIVCTATYTSAADEKLCLDLGADRFLRKPAAPEAVFAALDEVMRSATRRAPRHDSPFEDTSLTRQYSERLVAKLEERNAELASALARLQASEEKLQLVIRTEPECVKTVSPDGCLLDMNPAGLAMLEAGSIDELRGRPVDELVAPAHRAAFRRLHARVMAGGSGTLEFEAIGPRGATRWLETHAVPLREGERITALLGITRDVTARRQMEAALKTSEARYRRLVESGSIGVIIANVDGRVSEANNYFLRMLGYSREELEAGVLDWSGLTPPGWRDADERAAAQLRACGACDPFEKEYVHRDGHRVPIMLRAALLDESPGDCLCLITDLSERKRAEAAVYESERRLRQVVDGLGPNTFVGLLDLDGTLLLANRPALEAAGLRLEDVLGRPVEETPWFAYSVSVQEQLRAAVARAASGEPSRYDVEIRVTGGALIWIDLSIQPVRDADGRVIYLVPSANVIHERKRSEAALREKERLLSESQRVAKVGSWNIALPDWKATWSEETYRIYGVSPATFVPTADTFPGLVHPDDWRAVRGWTRACLAGEQPPGIELRAVNPDGRIRVLYALGERVVDAEGRVVGMIGTVQDITERKQAELDLQVLSGRLLQAQDEERRRIARELHDSTGQVLAALGMNLAVLARGGATLDPDQHALLADCEALAQRGTAELRTLSYLLHPPALDSLGLVRALEDYAQGFAQRSGLEVRLDLPDELPRLAQGIELALFRIVQESLGNVHRHARAERVSIRLARDGGSVAIEVRDDGRGLAESMLARAPERATGVGIAGMRERVRMLGGRLDVESCAPGTCVRAVLPVSGNAP